MKFLSTLVFLVCTCCVNAMPDIHFHAKDGRIEQVKELLSKDPNLINAKTESGDTPLHWAVRTGRTEVVHFLVEQGASLHAKNQFGKTCLHVAAEKNRSELIKFLVYKGADINDKSQDGETPLHEASRSHSIQAIQTLLELNADKEAKNNYGHTPLEKALTSRQFYMDSLQKEPNREDLKKGIQLYDQAIKMLETNVYKVPKIAKTSADESQKHPSILMLAIVVILFSCPVFFYFLIRPSLTRKKLLNKDSVGKQT